MKIFELNGKKFLLPKLTATVGRELMTKGQGLRNVLNWPTEQQMKFFSKIEVHLLGDNWVYMTTAALLDNHVTPDGKEQLLKAFLLHNVVNDALLNQFNQPTVADALWSTANEILDEVFNVYS